MQYLAEKTRQALGLGDRDFWPTSLEAEHRSVQEANLYGHQLHNLERAFAKWAASTDDVLCSAGHFLADAPRPRHFTQLDPCDPAALTAAPPELPPEFTLLNQPSLLRRLAAGTRLTVGDVLRLGLEEPIAVWLAALEAAKERLAGLEHVRIRYDAARRALHNASRAPEADELGTPAHLLLIQLEQEHEPAMSEFRDAQEALDRHLTWLVDGAARLKAAVVAALHAVNTAAQRGAMMPPEGLLQDFPRDLLERPETLRAAAAAPAGPAAAGTAAAMTEAAVEAATIAAIAASGLDVPPPQLVMLGPDVTGGASAGGATDVVMVVPPGTAGVATEAALQAATAVGRAAAEGTALTAPRVLREHEKMEERLLQAASTGGPATARLYKLATRPDRRAAVRAAWRSLVQMAMYAERHKTLAQHAKEQMQDVRERAGLTGGFLMRAEAAPEYVLAGRRRVPGGGPLQFLRDTLLGPPAQEPQPHRTPAATAAAAAATGGSAGAAPPHILTAPEPTSSTVNYAAAAREQMEEVATHGPGDTPSAALLSPTDTGVGRFMSDMTAGLLRDEQPTAAGVGVGGGGGGGGGGAGACRFATEAATGPFPMPGGVARSGVSEPPATSGSYPTPPQPAAGPTLAAPAVVPTMYAQPVEALLQRSAETTSDLAPPVPVPVETYAAGTMEDVADFPEMPYATPGTVTVSQAANRAAAAMSAADAAMDVAAASMEAATASMDAAVAATAAASVAMEAATDASVAAMDLDLRNGGDEAEVTSTAAVPDLAREYGITGASGPTGASSGGAWEEEEAPAAASAQQTSRATAAAAADVAAARPPTVAAPPPPENLQLSDCGGLHVAKQGCAAATVPSAAANTASEPVTPERLTEAPAAVGAEAVSEQLRAIHLGASDLEPTAAAKQEVEAVARTEEGTGGELLTKTGVPGLFGALKKMVEEETSTGPTGVGEEVRKPHREGVAAEPAGPNVVDG